MSKITTEDCKVFLVNHYKKLNVITKVEGWKRVKINVSLMKYLKIVAKS